MINYSHPIMISISKNLMFYVVLANILAWPTAFFAMNKWLQYYAYRIDLNLWIFVLSGLIALIVAFITISFQTVKAAHTNPVDTLKYE